MMVHKLKLATKMATIFCTKQISELGDSDTGELMIESSALFDVNVCEGLFLVFLSYYCFNIQYEKERKNALIFIEHFFLKWSITELTDEVKKIGNKLKLK